MRNRFFSIILTTLVLAAIGINLVHVKFFKSQRLKLIDQQIAESSSTLTASDDFQKSVHNPALIENSISRVLKGSRIGKVFVLRDSKSNILYQSFNVNQLEADLPIKAEWVTVETNTEFVRLRNLTLKGPDRILQVGLVLNRNFIDWEIIDIRVVNYVIGIVLALFLASVLLTLLLLAPLRHLILHLKSATSNLTNLKDVAPLPKRLTRYTSGFWAKSDEFSSLLNTVQKLIDRINLNYKLTRSWTLQMAHELKTPLAIIHAETQSKNKDRLLPEQYFNDVIKEIQQMTDIISQFLDWAELENSNLQRDLHALRIKSVVKTVATRLEKISPGRIKLNLNADFSVFSNPAHLDQLVSNLIVNALKFSSLTSQVEVTLAEKKLIIKDEGPGIPPEVRERIGEPFNVGSFEKEGLTGSGLGLAWVSTVSKLYQWKFEIESNSTGTSILIEFPTTEEN